MHFFAREKGKFYQIPLHEIEYIEAKKNYVNVNAAGSVYRIHSALCFIEEQLPKNLFCRIHRSFIIAISQVVCFDHEKVYLKNVELNIGMNFYEDLKSRVIIFGETAKFKTKADVSTVGFSEQSKTS